VGKIRAFPEIWQGHKDHGAGFWLALEFLTQIERNIEQENMKCKENTKPC
jgi:hypothetical protein